MDEKIAVKCNNDVFQHGTSEGIYDISFKEADDYCKKKTEETGYLHDWHRAAGRVHVKALIPTLEMQQAQTIKELQATIDRMEDEWYSPDAYSHLSDRYNELQAQVERMRNGMEYVLKQQPNMATTTSEIFEFIRDLLAMSPQQSLSAIRNEAIREGWDMAIDACLCARFPTSVFSDDDAYKTAILNYSSAIRNLPYPQLTEEE